MANENDLELALKEVVFRRKLNVNGSIYRQLSRLYALHNKYRTRAGLSAEMDVRGYLGEFILDIFELEAAGKLVDAEKWCDVGSGGGYPGLPLAIFKPGSSFTLLEPSRKKAEYLRIVVNELGIGNVTIYEVLAEDYSSKFAALTCKGLNLDFGEVLSPLVNEGGKAYIFRDTSGEDTERTAELFSYKNPWNGRQRYISIITN